MRPVFPRWPVTGVVQESSGEPVNQAEVVLVSRPVPWLECAGSLDEVRATTDARGVFQAEILAGLPDGDHPHQAWVFLAGGGKPAEGLEQDVGDLHLDRLYVVDLDLQQLDGAPAAHARVRLFFEQTSKRVIAAFVRPWLADHRGRARLLLPNGRMVLAASTGDCGTKLPRATAAGSLFGLREIGLNESEPRHLQLDVRLEPKVWIRGVVENPSGLRIAGANLRGNVFRPLDSTALVHQAIDDENTKGLYRQSGEDGRFELWHVPGAGSCALHLHTALDAAGQLYGGSSNHLLESEGTENVVVQLDCPDEVARASTVDWQR